jgi:hypothetical protein
MINNNTPKYFLMKHWVILAIATLYFSLSPASAQIATSGLNGTWYSCANPQDRFDLVLEKHQVIFSTRGRSHSARYSVEGNQLKFAGRMLVMTDGELDEGHTHWVNGTALLATHCPGAVSGSQATQLAATTQEGGDPRALYDSAVALLRRSTTMLYSGGNVSTVNFAPGTAAAFLAVLYADPNGIWGTEARVILTTKGTWPDWDGQLPPGNVPAQRSCSLGRGYPTNVTAIPCDLKAENLLAAITGNDPASVASAKIEDSVDPRAEEHLGYSYRTGQGVQQDYAQAFTWYRRAAEHGRDNAAIILGEMCENGEGTPQSYEQALTWYRKGTAGSYSVKANLHIRALLQKAPQLAAAEQNILKDAQPMAQSLVDSNYVPQYTTIDRNTNLRAITG